MPRVKSVRMSTTKKGDIFPSTENKFAAQAHVHLSL